MKRVVIQIEQDENGVYVASSHDLKGLAVECESQDQIFSLTREIAGDMLALDDVEDEIELDFEMIGSGA